jgi:hypothetical protein
MARLRRRGASSEHRRPAAYREPAFLDTITCFAKVSTETFVAEIFCHERRGIPRSFVQVGSIRAALSRTLHDLACLPGSRGETA